MVKGFNGNSIFLPFYGYVYDGSVFIGKTIDRQRLVYNQAAYWTRTLHATGNGTSTEYAPIQLSFSMDLEIQVGRGLRSCGFLVRPVFHPED